MQVRGKRAFGQLGEDKACAFLLAQGHRIVARNWRGSHLEVDIISEASDGLHFVEVKTRLDADAAPEEKVDAIKQRRISAAALKYLNETGSDREVFFDVVSVTLSAKAFSSSLGSAVAIGGRLPSLLRSKSPL